MAADKLNPRQFIIGRKVAVAICAAEGIYMSEKTKELFDQFAKEGLTPKEQRQRLRSIMPTLRSSTEID